MGIIAPSTPIVATIRGMTTSGLVTNHVILFSYIKVVSISMDLVIRLINIRIINKYLFAVVAFPYNMYYGSDLTTLIPEIGINKKTIELLTKDCASIKLHKVNNN